MYCEHDEIEHAEWIVGMEHAFFLITLGILVCFIIELLLLLFGLGWRFFTHPLYILDAMVVFSSFVLEIVLDNEQVSVRTGDASASAGGGGGGE